MYSKIRGKLISIGDALVTQTVKSTTRVLTIKIAELPEHDTFGNAKPSQPLTAKVYNANIDKININNNYIGHEFKADVAILQIGEEIQIVIENLEFEL